MRLARASLIFVAALAGQFSFAFLVIAETIQPTAVPVPDSVPGSLGQESGTSSAVGTSIPIPPESQSTVQPEAGLSESNMLQSLEERLFNRAYVLEKNSDRLLRLESFVFGLEGKGETRVRLEKLKKVLGGKTDSGSNSSSANETAANSLQKLREKPKGVLATINQGIDNYNRHRFHNAEDDFNDAMDLAPGMARVHVYLGATLLQLNQRQSAIDSMRTAYELDPFGLYGRYAKHCLTVLMGDEEVRRRGPKDNLKTVQNTIDSVNKRAVSEASRHNTAGQSAAQNRQISASNYANKLNSDPSSNDTYLKSNFVKMDAQVQATRAREEASRKAASTQEAANNLKELITAKLLPGDAKLRAFGTTLNARYYGDETYNLAPWYIPREMPLELKASAALMRGAKALQYKSKSAPKSGKSVSHSNRKRAHANSRTTSSRISSTSKRGVRIKATGSSKKIRSGRK